MATDARALELLSLGEKLFTDKKQLDSLCQEIAWQFCPDLASFTTKLILGQDFAIDRMDSYPEQMSRELSNQLSAMLRRSDQPWFRVTTLNDEIDADEDNARYLEYVGRVVRQGIYDPRSKFIRATKLADRFFVNFGQAVISVEEAPETRDHLFFRTHHFKNCAWLENKLGDVDHLHRKELMAARKMAQLFQGDRLSSSVKEAAEKTPNKEIETRVIVMPADEYDTLSKGEGKRNGKKLPYVAIYIDVENQRVLRESGLPEFIYCVPRWNMFAESQYAFSPCTMVALPDARMAQMMNQILLEAGEKSIDPPLIAKQEIVIGEPNIQAGGISWVDLEHDASLKEAIDAIRLEPDMKTGFAMRQDLREMLSKAFFIDKLAMPEPTPRMTAFELGQRLQEHIRNLLPLFEPMQIEYNTRLLDKTYATLRNMNAFKTDGSGGTPPLPPALAAADVTWTFESPLQSAKDQILVEYFKGSLELVGLGMQAGATANPIKTDKALRDAIRGMGTPATWRKDQAEFDQEAQQQAQQKQAMAAVQAAHGVAQVAETAGKAGKNIGEAGQTLGLLPPAAQKITQGAAQGSPETAGALGMAAPDVGDQGPAGNPNESIPQPWMPDQTQAALSGNPGTRFDGLDQALGQATSPQTQTPTQPQSTALVPAQRPRTAQATAQPRAAASSAQPRDASSAAATAIAQVARDLVRELSVSRGESMRAVSDIASMFGESNMHILAKFYEATSNSGKSNTDSLKLVRELMDSLAKTLDTKAAEKEMLQSLKKIADSSENKDAEKELLQAVQQIVESNAEANANALRAVEKATQEIGVAMADIKKPREITIKRDAAGRVTGATAAQ